jgi:peptide chain release factor subunit 1
MEQNKLYLKSAEHAIITIYLSVGTGKEKMLKLLKKEEPIVQNIQSRVTRQSLERSFQRMKTFLENLTPSEKGYVIVASPDELVWTSDVLVSQDLYRCGSEFYAGPYEEIQMQQIHSVGIITLDTKEATLGRVSDKIEILKYLTSGIPGKSHKGGSSQRRYERERDMAVAAFFKRIGDAAKLFVDTYPIEELLISGCGQTKDEFLKAKYLDYRLKEKVTMVLDTQYTGEFGIRETLHKALPQLEKNAFGKEIVLVESFFTALAQRFDSVVYGKEEIQKHLHQIKRLIIIEELKDEYPKDKYPNVTILCFKGEHYQKIQSLGGVVGFK